MNTIEECKKCYIEVVLFTVFVSLCEEKEAIRCVIDDAKGGKGGMMKGNLHVER